MKKSIFVLCLFLSLGSFAQINVNKNFAIGFGTGVVVGSLNDLSAKESLFASIALGTAVGVIAENYQRGHSSVGDVRTANWNSLFGAALSGIIVYHVKNHFWKNQGRKKRLFMF